MGILFLFFLLFNIPSIVKFASQAHAQPLNQQHIQQRVATWVSIIQSPEKTPLKTLMQFVQHNSDWPLEHVMINEIESQIHVLSTQETLKWFDAREPKTAEGTVTYIKTLSNKRGAQAATNVLKKLWPTLRLTTEETEMILNHFSSLLTSQDHIARIDPLIWSQKHKAARVLLPYISVSNRAVYTARLSLAQRKSSVESDLAALPAHLKKSSAVAYERIRWRRRAGNDAGALALLNDPQVDQSQYPRKWWTERHILIRRAIENLNWAHALRIVSGHRQTTGLPYFQASFLKGWLALKVNPKNTQSTQIFKTMYSKAKSPISQSRAAYWAGRAYEAQNKMAEAQNWYRKAAIEGIYYYGQLASTRLGQSRLTIPWVRHNAALGLTSDLKNTLWAQVIQSLKAQNHAGYADMFLTRLMRDATSEADYHFITSLAKSVQHYDFTIRAAKSHYNKHRKVISSAYPDLPHLETHRASRAHVLGLIRQESLFEPTAGSHAGAQGLMQLMPATAKEAAGELGLQYSFNRLTQDPDFNTRLGTYYLEKKIKYYKGDLIKATAAYNAGFGRVNGWVKTFEAANLDPVDWIESLPVYETRNYIQRVFENARVYDEILKTQTPLLQNSKHKLHK